MPNKPYGGGGGGGCPRVICGYLCLHYETRRKNIPARYLKLECSHIKLGILKVYINTNCAYTYKYR